MAREMNRIVGSTYPLPGIGRVCFADEHTEFPCVLMDDGYSTQEQHDYMLSRLRQCHNEMEITADGDWEPMPWLDHTGEKHHFLNVTSKRK